MNIYIYIECFICTAISHLICRYYLLHRAMWAASITFLYKVENNIIKTPFNSKDDQDTCRFEQIPKRTWPENMIPKDLKKRFLKEHEI